MSEVLNNTPDPIVFSLSQRRLWVLLGVEGVVAFGCSLLAQLGTAGSTPGFAVSLLGIAWLFRCLFMVFSTLPAQRLLFVLGLTSVIPAALGAALVVLSGQGSSVGFWVWCGFSAVSGAAALTLSKKKAARS